MRGALVTFSLTDTYGYDDFVALIRAAGAVSTDDTVQALAAYVRKHANG